VWKPLPSPADGIRNPNIAIVDGGGGHLGVVVSEWSDGSCFRAHAIEFKRPEAYCSVDEATYSNRSRDPTLDYSAYLQVAALSDDLKELAETRSMMTGREIELKQYLLVGLTECLEVVCSTPPRVSLASSYEEARAIAAHRVSA
jgi:hypothetical protein